ncbi:MAG: glycosyltransferase, partial [Kiloniellales bacterium]
SGGVPAVVRDGETGLLAAEGDADAFAAALTALLDDPSRRAALAAAAAERAARMHDIADAAQRLDALLGESMAVS